MNPTNAISDRPAVKTLRKFLERVRGFFARHARVTAYLALTLICLTMIAHLVARALIDTYPQGKDEFQHLINVEKIAYFLEAESKTTGLSRYVDAFINPHLRYPPLRYALAMIFRSFFSPANNFTTAIASNIPFVFLLVFGFYWLCRDQVSRFWSVLAVFVLVFHEPILKCSGEFTMTFPMIAMTVFGYALLVRLPVFQRLWATILFGVFFGLGFMTYYFFLVYFGGAAFACFLWKYIKLRSQRKKVFGHALLFSATIAVVSSPYYLTSAFRVLLSFEFSQLSRPNYMGAPPDSFWQWSLQWLGPYIKILTPSGIILGVYLLVLIFGWRRLKNKDFWIPPLVGLASSFLFFFLFVGKNAEYIVPLVLYPVLFLNICLTGVPRRLQAVLVVVMLVVFVPWNAYSNLRNMEDLSWPKYQSVFQPALDDCAQAQESCLIALSCNYWDCNDYILIRLIGYDPNRRWLQMAQTSDGPEQKIDYIFIFCHLDNLNNPEIRLNDDSTTLEVLPRNVITRIDPGQDRYSFFLEGRDISADFVKQAEYRAGSMVLATFRNINRIAPKDP